MLPTLKSGLVLFFLIQGIWSAPQENDAIEVTESGNDEGVGETVSTESEMAGGFGGASGQGGAGGGARGGAGGSGGMGGGMGAGMGGGMGGAIGGVGGGSGRGGAGGSGSMGGSVGGGMGGAMGGRGGGSGRGGAGGSGGMGGGVGGAMGGAGGRGGSAGWSSSSSSGSGRGSSRNGGGSGLSAMFTVPGVAVSSGGSVGGGVMDFMNSMATMAANGVDAGRAMGTHGVNMAANVVSAIPRAMMQATSGNTGGTVFGVSSSQSPNFDIQVSPTSGSSYSGQSLAFGIPAFGRSQSGGSGYSVGVNSASAPAYSVNVQRPGYSYDYRQANSEASGDGGDFFGLGTQGAGDAIGQRVAAYVPSSEVSLTLPVGSGSSTGSSASGVTSMPGLGSLRSGAEYVVNAAQSAQNAVPQIATSSSNGAGGLSVTIPSSYASSTSSASGSLPAGYTIVANGNTMSLMNGDTVMATFLTSQYEQALAANGNNILATLIYMWNQGIMQVGQNVQQLMSAFMSGIAGIGNIFGNLGSTAVQLPTITLV